MSKHDVLLALEHFSIGRNALSVPSGCEAIDEGEGARVICLVPVWLLMLALDVNVKVEVSKPAPALLLQDMFHRCQLVS